MTVYGSRIIKTIFSCIPFLIWLLLIHEVLIERTYEERRNYVYYRLLSSVDLLAFNKMKALLIVRWNLSPRRICNTWQSFEARDVTWTLCEMYFMCISYFSDISFFSSCFICIYVMLNLIKILKKEKVFLEMSMKWVSFPLDNQLQRFTEIFSYVMWFERYANVVYV